jgi:hypothetical protein
MLKNADGAGMKYFFVEQEEYASTPLQSLQQDLDYLKRLEY